MARRRTAAAHSTVRAAAPAADERHFHAIADSASDMIAVLDANGRRLYANPALIRLLGRTGSLVGSDSLMDIHPEDRERMRALFRQVATEGRGARAGYRLIDGQGTVRHGMEDRLSELNRELESRIEARTAQLAASKRPLENTVAELRAREEDARRVLEQERELHDLKLRLVSVTNHEFRTPLTTILSAAELLRCYDARFSGEERLEMLDGIRSAVGRMTELLDQVLAIGRSEAGRQVFRPERQGVVAFARDLPGCRP